MCKGCLVEDDGMEVLCIEIPKNIELMKVSLTYMVFILNKKIINLNNSNYFAKITILISLETFKLFSW